jgi:hypothetical protein
MTLLTGTNRGFKIGRFHLNGELSIHHLELTNAQFLSEKIAFQAMSRTVLRSKLNGLFVRLARTSTLPVPFGLFCGCVCGLALV